MEWGAGIDGLSVCANGRKCHRGVEWSDLILRIPMTIPAVEDLQPIADKLTEAQQKIYEAVQLAAQLGIKPRPLTNICSIIEHIDATQMELLEASKRTPSNHPPMYPSARLNTFEIPSEEIERMRRDFLEQMELNRRSPVAGLAISGRRLGDMQPEEVEKIKAEIAKTKLERELVDSCHAMQDGNHL